MLHYLETARRSPRFDVGVPVTVRIRIGNKETAFEAEILNISEGGAFIHGVFPVALGDRLTIEVSLTGIAQDADSETFMQLKSEVCWLRGSSESGFGIRFTEKENERRGNVARLIDKLVFQSLAA
jgi:hypothetical protein